MSHPLSRRLLHATAVLLLGLACAGQALGQESRSISSAEVLKEARAFPDGGGYDRSWKGSGTPEEIRFAGERILRAGTEKNGKATSYCCGFTFTVFMRLANRHDLLKGRSVTDVKRLQKTWYGTTKRTAERQSVLALEDFGLGKTVKHAAARPGDFVQFWRTNRSGHSVIFLAWITEKGQRVGLRYRSSQGSTKGIGDVTERFSTHGGKIDAKRLHIGRLRTP